MPLPAHPRLRANAGRRPEWRKNPFTGQWVVFAPERAARPMLNVPLVLPTPADGDCPFCTGREAETPPELDAEREPGTAPDGPGWHVRVVPNRYAAVRQEGQPTPETDGFYERADGVGQHELIIECPHHEENLARLSDPHLARIVSVWQRRMRALARMPRFRHAQLFKNHGADAGASVPHCHSQIIATPLVPDAIRHARAIAHDHHLRTGECLTCDVLHRERIEGVRAVDETDGYVALVPFAARQPFETWLFPTHHRSNFEDVPDAELPALATLLGTVLRRQYAELDRPAYNVVLHTAPFHEPPDPAFHWRLELIPRITQSAGYEWGTGSFINPVLPEDAAAILRESRTAGPDSMTS